MSTNSSAPYGADEVLHSSHLAVSEFDSAEAALEVIVLWGEHSVLHVAHLSPPRAFFVGDTAGDGEPPVDVVLGAESLGCERLPVALHEDGAMFAVVPSGASGYVARGADVLSFDELAAQGLLSACEGAPGAQRVRLGDGDSARIEHREFTFIVSCTRAARRIGVSGGGAHDWQASRFTLGSVLLHLALLCLFYFAPPRSTVLAIDRLAIDSRMVDYVLTADETVPPDPEWITPANDDGGGQGKTAADEAGEMGKKDAPVTRRKFAVAGPPDNAELVLARDQARALMNDNSIIGILLKGGAAVDAPTSPFGREQALGSDAESAQGALFGDRLGISGGFGGLGPHGTGRGGGHGVDGSIGVGQVATRGVGGGTGSGYGNGVGVLGVRGPIVPPAISHRVDVRGSLSKEVIRRVIARHLNEVRYCYEQGLQTRPDLQGRVAVKFVIGPTGAVNMAAAADAQLQDLKVQACIVAAVKRWNFPTPEGGGVVVVTYPFVLQQAGN